MFKRLSSYPKPCEGLINAFAPFGIFELLVSDGEGSAANLCLNIFNQTRLR